MDLLLLGGAILAFAGAIAVYSLVPLQKPLPPPRHEGTQVNEPLYALSDGVRRPTEFGGVREFGVMLLLLLTGILAFLAFQ